MNSEAQEVIEDSSAKLYVWSSWGSWSPCSRTCGGGVSVQERQCLPRSRNPAVVPNTTLDTPTIRVRVTRQTSQDCLGISKRYHECNTAPCLTGEKDMRAEQCSSYDRRPFRGRFYTWVPYVDGNSPCLLNCRPLGQQFYASLSLVADGSPCTKPGYRAMCVQGSFQKYMFYGRKKFHPKGEIGVLEDKHYLCIKTSFHKLSISMKVGPLVIPPLTDF
nr:thrombospondin type-1 domain-containing protein 4-like [Maniola hyperantus]